MRGTTPVQGFVLAPAAEEGGYMPQATAVDGLMATAAGYEVEPVVARRLIGGSCSYGSNEAGLEALGKEDQATAQL